MQRILWLIGVLLLAGATGTSVRIAPEVRGKVSAAATGLPRGDARVSTVLTKWQNRNSQDEFSSLQMPDSGRFDLFVLRPTFRPVKIQELVACEGTVLDLDILQKEPERDLGIVIQVRTDQEVIASFGLGGFGLPSIQDSTNEAFDRMRDSLLVEETGLRLSENGEVFIRGGRAGEVSYMYDCYLPSLLDFLASSPFDVDQVSSPGSPVRNVTRFRRNDVQPHDDEFAPNMPIEFSLDFPKSKPLHSKY